MMTSFTSLGFMRFLSEVVTAASQVVVCDIYYQAKQQAAGLIKGKIAGILRHSKDFTKVVAVPRARCPVVKFVHTPSGINCDMSINNRLATDSVFLSDDKLCWWIRIT